MIDVIFILVRYRDVVTLWGNEFLWGIMILKECKFGTASDDKNHSIRKRAAEGENYISGFDSFSDAIQSTGFFLNLFANRGILRKRCFRRYRDRLRAREPRPLKLRILQITRSL